uniref:Mucin 1, cell surface associated n=1 Tax=Oryctolagus cuniculus TaxID=9986 RepID=A0A5F9DH56_RABIT
MPPGMDIRSPFFLLLLLPGITGEGCETLALQSRPGPGSAERRIASMTGGSLPTLSPGSGSAAIPGQIVITSAPATSPTSVSATSPVHEVTSAPATNLWTEELPGPLWYQVQVQFRVQTLGVCVWGGVVVTAGDSAEPELGPAAQSSLSPWLGQDPWWWT